MAMFFIIATCTTIVIQTAQSLTRRREKAWWETTDTSAHMTFTVADAVVADYVFGIVVFRVGVTLAVAMCLVRL